MIDGAQHLRNANLYQKKRQEVEKHALLISQHQKKHLNCHKLQMSYVQSPKPLAIGYGYFSRSFHVPFSPRKTLLCRRQEKQLASTIVLSQLGKAPGFHPPQKTAAAPALHIKIPPIHKAQHWWIRWHLLSHIHVLTVSLYICCQILSRGEKHFFLSLFDSLFMRPSHMTYALISWRCLASYTNMKMDTRVHYKN